MPKTTKPGGRHAVQAASAYQKGQKTKARKNREHKARQRLILFLSGKGAF